LRFLPARSVTQFDVRDPVTDLDPLRALLNPRPAMVVDGLFGIGLNRRLSPSWCALIECINEARLRVLSVDVPSGLNADTGASFGAVIRAEETLTVGSPKTGLLTGASVPWVGRLSVACPVGLLPWEEVEWPSPFEVLWNEPLDYADYPPVRPAWFHKGNFGHLGIVSGSYGYHGASVLATRAAARARPGTVTLCTAPQTYSVVASQLASSMVRSWEHMDDQLTGRVDAWLVGPGLAGGDVSESIRDWFIQLWRKSDVPIVVDASALDWVPKGAVESNALRVLTPHPGEAGRMLGIGAQEVERDRLTALRSLSACYGGAWVVLKGRHTAIGRESGEVVVNSTGNPGLGQGGSGDVLAGYLAGLITQPPLRQNIRQTLGFGVWEHGATADILEMDCPNWTPEDLAVKIGSSRCL
jgi:NAD(P)H-hydrate epimerase